MYRMTEIFDAFLDLELLGELVDMKTHIVVMQFPTICDQFWSFATQMVDEGVKSKLCYWLTVVVLRGGDRTPCTKHRRM